MTTLYYRLPGRKIFVIATAPIYVLDETFATLDFEVFPSNAEMLWGLIGHPETFYFNSEFSGQLDDLVEVDPTHQTLQFLHRPVLRGVIRKFSTQRSGLLKLNLGGGWIISGC